MCRVVLDQGSPLPHPSFPRDWRRRSADVGGLHLATTSTGHGHNWLGGNDESFQTKFAEMLSDMYTETLNSVNDNSLDSLPADLPIAVRDRLIRSLDRWNFEPHNLPDEEVLECTLILFEALFRIEGMKEAIPLTMKQITAFIHHLRRIYRYENTYHNFEHALDVLQATQSYLKSAGMVPAPTILFEQNGVWKSNRKFNSSSLVTSLGLRELFILYVAAIGHDVGHPGFTNMFMKNAATPLSVIFDHRSALEQMHCQLLLKVMRHHGFGVILDHPTHGQHCKKILLQSVLATDMSVHDDFVKRFQLLLNGETSTLPQRQIIICQAILKNADISNPTRPFLVSQHWAKALMQEWTAQALLEEEYALKPSVMSSDDPIQEAGSQIFFITRFVKPLSESTVRAIPEMSMYLHHCKMNLATWTARKADLLKKQAAEKAALEAQILRSRTLSSVSASSSIPPTPALSSQAPTSSTLSISPLSPPLASPRQTDHYNTAFPLTLPTYPPVRAYLEDTLVNPTCASYASSSVAPSRSSDHDSSQPESPSESESVISSVFSPVSDSSSSHRGSQASYGSSGSVQRICNGSTISRKQSNGQMSNGSKTTHLKTSSSKGNLKNPFSLRPPTPPMPSSRSSSRLDSNPPLPDSLVIQQRGRSPSASSTRPPTPPTPHAAIRAASKLGSLRKNPHHKRRDDGSRNSWCATTTLNKLNLSSLFANRPPSPSPSSVGSLVGAVMKGAEEEKSTKVEVKESPAVAVDAPPPPASGFMMSRPIKLQVLP
ncbi:hypothetical protein CVT24_011953 [Panaeolus cyanescens]|uniref:Phosphodiesterase n=1 Tax=Panaeolus cyanescens TaxID=181874 RepID=A0A409VIA5_9AGAR|nr:hypothetical protein CVT24_011953 [Panaeolus cyanescens]